MSVAYPTLKIVSLAAFGSMAAARVCDPMLGALSQEFGVSKGGASSVISAYAIAYGVMQLVYGPFGDRLGKLRVVAFAALVCAVLNGLTAVVTDLNWLVWTRAAAGAASAGIVPLTLAWIGDQVPYAQRQETLARMMGATVSGMMLGQWLGGLLAEHVSWRVAFAALAVLFLIAGLLLKANVAQTPVPVHAERFSLPAYLIQSWRLLRSPRVRWVLTLTGIEGAIAFAAFAFAPSQLVLKFGVSATWAGGLMILYGMGGLMYSQLARRWLTLLGERGLALVGGALIATGLLLLAWTGEVLLGGLACLVAGLGFYMLHNTLQTQATQMAPEARGAAMTFFSSVLFLGQSIGVALYGTGLDAGFLSGSFTTAALSVVVLSGVVARGVKGRHAP